VSDEPGTDVDERARLIRGVRHRLEALGRAGLDRIPVRGTLPEPAEPAPTLPPPRPPTATVARPLIELPVAEPKAVARPKPVLEPAPTFAASLFEEPAFEAPAIPAEVRPAMLAAMAAEVSGCVRCPILAETRTQTVFGTGSPTARLMFIGEAPGAEEDRTGIPFVGRSGELLTAMITKGMGLEREDVYIANILKSRPPENRTPLPAEIANCLPYLERQIAIIRPEYLCLLGRTASVLLETALPIGRLRGKWHRYRGIPSIVTYHPSYLLRNPAAKKDAWDDLRMLMQAMGLKGPERSR